MNSSVVRVGSETFGWLLNAHRVDHNCSFISFLREGWCYELNLLLSCKTFGTLFEHCGNDSRKSLYNSDLIK